MSTGCLLLDLGAPPPFGFIGTNRAGALDGVGTVIDMTTGAGVLFPKPMIRVDVMPTQMLAPSDQLQMVQIYAPRVFAAVVEDRAARNLAVLLLVTGSIDVNEDTILPHHWAVIAFTMMTAPTLTWA